MTKRRSLSASPNAAFDSDFVERSFRHFIFQLALIFFVSPRSALRSRRVVQKFSLTCLVCYNLTLARTFERHEYKQNLFLFVKQRMQNYSFSINVSRTDFWTQLLFIAFFYFCIFILFTFFISASRLSQSRILIHRRYNITKRRSSHNAFYRTFFRILSANKKKFERFEVHTASLSKKKMKIC